MAKKASSSLKIRYAHVPKTPVYTANGWDYKVAPSQSELATSAAQLKSINTNATEAKTEAATAAAAAKSAQTAAASKASMSEVKGLFPIETQDNSERVVTDIKFHQGTDGGWTMFLCTAPVSNPQSGTCVLLAYATSAQLAELAATVETLKNDVKELKKKAGI